jgi:hypothetical protein
MFDYTDPVGGAHLADTGSLARYRALVHAGYRRAALRPRSAFTLPEAFVESGRTPESAVVSWLAFPRLQNDVSDDVVDSDRFNRQEEYVEWRSERDAAGNLVSVTFTTEFSEYYEALAATSADAVTSELGRLAGGVVSNRDVFGPRFDPDRATASGRSLQLLEMARRNPWTNGDKGIAFLMHGSNTLGALFALLAECAVPNTRIDASEVCGAVSGACVPGRSSDPAVCQAVQELARQKMGFTLADPAGIQILRLGGIWKMDGEQIDVGAHPEIWKISRNGRRAVLKVPAALTLGDDAIPDGAAVARKLTVGAKVVFLPDADLPSWARAGQESSRMLTD